MMATDTSNKPAVRIDRVSKRFGRQTALRDLSLTIPKGTSLGLLGQNGAGKTTMMKLLMGLLRRDAGEVSVLDSDPASDAMSVRRRVGYVPEEQFIYRWMRVHEVAKFCRTFYPTWNDALCDELMRSFELDPNKRVKHLSKGMTVKLSLLVALSHEPEVLLLDEPMAGLDPIAREELLEGVLQTVTDHARTILFSSHTLSDVQRLADVIGIIHEGELLVHSPVDNLLRGTKRIRAVLRDGVTPGTPPEGTIRQQVRSREWLLTVSGFSSDLPQHLQSTNDLEQVDVIDLNLEDIFKDYIRGWKASL